VPSSSSVRLSGIVACVAAMLLDPLSSARADAPSQWVGTWAASPLAQLVAPGLPPALTFNNQTVRQVVRVSAGGEELMIRLTNEFSSTALLVGEVHVAYADKDGKIIPGTDRLVTFGGTSTITIPAGAPALSDPIKMPVRELARLAISIYLPVETAPATTHTYGLENAYVSLGNTTATVAPATLFTSPSRYLLSGVHVRSKGGAQHCGKRGTLVAFGDSITDGFNSTVGANKRWPDLLAERFAAAPGPQSFAVVNEGIGGNRVLHDLLGPNALARFDRDVLSVPGANSVVMLEGINDIGFSVTNPAEAITAEDLIDGYRQIIARAHVNGLTIYGGTLLPFEGAFYVTPQGEALRQAANDFIRNSGEFDGVIDFDAATRDPAQPTRIKPAFDSGDHLHPNDAGYAAMSEAAFRVLR
jgi:lysophospholipase L1-like esterase